MREERCCAGELGTAAVAALWLEGEAAAADCAEEEEEEEEDAAAAAAAALDAAA